MMRILKLEMIRILVFVGMLTAVGMLGWAEWAYPITVAHAAAALTILALVSMIVWFVWGVSGWVANNLFKERH